MGWNYRVIRSEDDMGDPSYAIHECHYDSRGQRIPTSWAAKPAAMLSETRDGLLWFISTMAEAVSLPVLEERNGTLFEVEPKKEFSDDMKAVIEKGKLVGTGDYEVPESH